MVFSSRYRIDIPTVDLLTYAFGTSNYLHRRLHSEIDTLKHRHNSTNFRFYDLYKCGKT